MATAGEAGDSSAYSPSVPLRPMLSPVGPRPQSSLSSGRDVPRVRQSSSSSQSALSGRLSSGSGLRLTTSAAGSGAVGCLPRQSPFTVSLSSGSSGGDCSVAAGAAREQRYAVAEGSDSASDGWCPRAAPSNSSRGSCSSSGATAGLAAEPVGCALESGAGSGAPGSAGSGSTTLAGTGTGSLTAGLARGRAGAGAPARSSRHPEQARAQLGRAEAARRGPGVVEAAGPSGDPYP